MRLTTLTGILSRPLSLALLAGLAAYTTLFLGIWTLSYAAELGKRRQLLLSHPQGG